MAMPKIALNSATQLLKTSKITQITSLQTLCKRFINSFEYIHYEFTLNVKRKKDENDMGNSLKIDEQKIQAGGHIYIGKAVREALKLEKGDTIEVHVINEEIILRKQKGSC